MQRGHGAIYCLSSRISHLTKAEMAVLLPCHLHQQLCNSGTRL